MPREVIGKGVLHEGCKCLLYGPKKLGKSTVVCQFCLSMMYGEDWLKTFSIGRGMSVLYVQSEIRDAMLWRRLSKMSANYIGKHKHGEVVIWNTGEERIKLDTHEGAGQLYKHIEMWRPTVVILDPLYKLISRPGDPDCVLEWQDNIDLACNKYGTAFMIVAHPRKPKEEDDTSPDTNDFYGPAWYTAWTDATIKLSRGAKDSPVDSRVLHVTDTRNAEEVIPQVTLKFNRQTLLFEPTLLV